MIIKAIRFLLLIIIAVFTFPIGLILLLGFKLYEGSNYKVAQRKAFAKVVNGIAGGEVLKVPEYSYYNKNNKNTRQNYNNNYSNNSDDSESYGKERERNVGSFLKMLERLDNYKDLQSYIMNYNSDVKLTDEEVKEIGYQIYTHLSNEKPTR